MSRLVAVVSALLLTGCGSAYSRAHGAVQTHSSPVARLAGGPPAHVAVLVMENQEFSEVIGNRAAPYINSLARRYALAANLYAVTHPSLPNYLALTGGSTFGIDRDCTDCAVRAPGLPDQLTQRRIPWKAYMEGLPASCFTGASSGEYAKKHNPFAYYTTVSGTRQCRNTVPLAQLAVDESGHRLPRFSWITPNLCHDMHDCDVSTGDRFLARLVPPLLAAMGRRGLLFLVWDEGSSDNGCCRLASGGHVVGIVAGGAAARRARLIKPVDHYSVLQTIEDLLGLPRLRGAACPCTPSLEPLLAARRT